MDVKVYAQWTYTSVNDLTVNDIKVYPQILVSVLSP